MIKRHRIVGYNFEDNQTIWKYFSLDHFQAMIESKTLYMGRADSYEDKREILATKLHAYCFKMSLDALKRSIDRDKENSYLSCWTMLEHESYLMWKAYSNLNNGIVIKSTPRRLINSYTGDNAITIGKVQYIDEKTDSAQPYGAPINWLYLVFSKLWFYEDEKELRLYFNDFKKTGNNIIPVNLSTLIEEVRVAPKADTSLLDDIKTLVASEGLECPVRKSEIEIQ